MEAELYARAGRLFDDLVDLDEAERERALERAFADDPEAAALARRLIVRDRSERASPIDAGSIPPGTPSAALDPDDPAGVLGMAIGPYEVEALLGSGGMGAVYLARRRDPDARVAIKFVTLSAAPAAALERFRSEAQLLASVDHPGVVRYRDSGVDRRGRPYLVMDHVDGVQPSHRLPEVAASVERTVAIVVAMAEAVHHLHQRRVLHRDLKPSNVLLRREGKALLPVVLDLGVARALADPANANGPATATGTLGLGPVGTPAFMSPEQARGATNLDVRTDVHGLGAVLYALLTGRPPRELDALPDDDPLAFHERVRSEARPPSSRVDPAGFPGDRAARRARAIDRDLDAIVLKAIALEPDDRYGSAEAFAADLLRWHGHMPVTARLIGPLGRLQKAVRRRPLQSALIAGALALLAGTSVVTSVSLSREARARRQYEEQLATTEAVNLFFTEDVFARALPEFDGPQVPVIDVLRDAADGVGERLDGQPADAVAVRGALLGVFERLGATDEADEQMRRAAALVPKLAPAHPQRLRYEFELGVAFTRRSRWAEAEQVLRGVVERAGDSATPLPELEGMAASVLGVVLLSRNELAEAGRWIDLALERIPAGDPRRFEVLNNLALLEWSRGDRDATIDALRDLLTQAETRYGPDHTHVVGVCSNLATLYLDRREPGRALPYARRALAVAEKIFDATHPDRLSAMNQLASCLSYREEYDEAIRLRREIHAARLAALGAENPSVAEAQANLASVLVRADRFDEALEPAREALDVLVRTLGELSPTTASACLTMATAEEGAGRPDTALELFDRAIAIYEQAEGDHATALEEAHTWRARTAERARAAD